MEDLVIVSAVRTPFAAFGGTLKDFSLPTLGSIVIAEALARAKVQPEEVDEIAMGVNLPGSDRSIARQAMLKAGIPEERVAYTVDRACCSSLVAITLASRGVRSGDAAIAVAGGTENMSKVPYFVHDARWGHRLGDIVLKDQLVISCPHTGVPRAVQAGEEAVKFGVSREEQDEWAFNSQERYFAADAAGKFADELVPVKVKQRKGPAIPFEKDESPRRTTLEKLAQLQTIYGSPTVTAGNAPGLNTGASALVLMSRRLAEKRGIQPLAILHTTAMVSGHPHSLASIPAVAAKKALDRVGKRIEEMDVIEINEAFAAMPLVSTLVLAGNDVKKAQALRARTNVNGGAIALGHPTGATAARLVMTTAYELRRRGGGWGVATLCGGIGEGEAAVVEVPPSW
ncbi:MAG: thiolase family protein [Candidatus Tectomicrobia bacterium]|nr:thiolase family protein [Candidatus Tectomicrobia bacterium]